MHVHGVCAILATLSAIVRPASTQHYTRQWVMHVPGGAAVADQVAADHGFHNLGEIFQDYYHFSHPRIVRRSTFPHHGKRVQLAVDTRIAWAQQQRAKRRAKRDFQDFILYSDPRWPSMWYLNRGNGMDMNVIPAWQEGITGKGSVVTILDDGLEKDHPDLIQNYDPMASYDVNNQDTDPSPRYDMIDSNRHGTRCAGEVAATSNNSICSLGVAHGAQVGGVRMLDGDVTDAVEARSLSLNPQHIDIYSASWGPDDDGKTVDGPGELATRAFVEGVTKGRNGKGSIFVWASGNGGRDHDNCNCDGYTNSIYSLSISSATEHGRVPWYSEACSSTLATTYSSGEVGERQVITTDLHHACTASHTGTSASAPLAAGICALALEANPKLTWRDMQHIVVRTARPQRLIAHDWQTNGVGRNVSHSFGYGLMDAHAMVKLARKWITVPEQHSYEVNAPQTDKKIPARSVVVLSLTVTDAGQVKVLEHVQAKLTISSHKRGDLNIQLISPMGTRVTLLAHRIHDLSRNGFTHWPFMSVHSWGESPLGTWTLEVHNDGRLLAEVHAWDLVFYGTATPPAVDGSVSKDTPSMTKAPAYSPSEDINENVIDSDEEPNGNPEIRKDLMEEEEFSQQAMSGCKQSRGGVCIVCMEGYYFFDNSCVDRCPLGFYVVTYTEYNYDPSEVPAILACEPCHYSCKACNASNDYSCTECFPDAFLYNRTTSEHYCYPLTIQTSLLEEVWCFRVFITLLLALAIIIIGAIVFIFKKTRQNRKNPQNSRFMKMDSLMHIRDIERRVKSAVYSDSE